MTDVRARPMPSAKLRLIERHQRALRACRRCPNMLPPVVSCGPVVSRVLLVGQAPGVKEPVLGHPFAWTAGKQLFKWFSSLGLGEADFRERVHMAAVCRCFPGKNAKGGDRVPTPVEIQTCRRWLDREIEILSPDLVIPVGRLAIEQFLPPRPLVDQIGKAHQVTLAGRSVAVIPLPHPSGASTWPRTEPGRTLTAKALGLLGKHPAFRAVLAESA
jgi:uracil-DNA glycosylase